MKNDNEEAIIRYIFNTYQTIAVYGMSNHQGKPAYNVPKFLKTKGYHIIPINPNHHQILQLKCYPNLLNIDDIVEIVQVFRPSKEAVLITKEAILRKSLKNDVSVIWLQKGLKNKYAQTLAQKNDILFIQDKCMYEMYRTIFPSLKKK